MVVLAVTWMANPGNEEQVAEVFRKLQAASREEPGCLLYIVHRHKTDPRRFFIYEQYRDDAAMQTHRASAHFQRYVVSELKDFAVRSEGELFTPLE